MPSETRDQWESLIGRFILVCGNIELRLLQIHWNLSIIDQVKIKKIKKFGLANKARELLKTIDKRRLEIKLKERLNRILNATIEFAEYRNLVAHNPLSMSYYDDPQGRMLPPPIIISLRDNKEHISFKNLHSKLDEAKVIEAELYSLVCESGRPAINRFDDNCQA